MPGGLSRAYEELKRAFFFAMFIESFRLSRAYEELKLGSLGLLLWINKPVYRVPMRNWNIAVPTQGNILRRGLSRAYEELKL